MEAICIKLGAQVPVKPPALSDDWAKDLIAYHVQEEDEYDPSAVALAISSSMAGKWNI